MKRKKLSALLICAVMLCAFFSAAQAEKRMLAFGYEVDIPDGSEITKEEWNPDNLKMLYYLEGTYANGKERFQLIWYDETQMSDFTPSIRVKDGFTLSTLSIRGTLYGTSSVGGNYEGEIYDMVSAKMGEMSKQLEHALSNTEAYTEMIDSMVFKKVIPTSLGNPVFADEGHIFVQEGMNAKFGSGKIVVMDDEGHTILWMSKIPDVKIPYSMYADEQMLTTIIRYADTVIKCAGLNPQKYDLSMATQTDNAWIGMDKEYCLTMPEKNGEGFAVIKAYPEGTQLIVFEGGCSWDEAISMSYSAILYFKKGMDEKKIFPIVVVDEDEYKEAIRFTLPIGKEQFVVDIADFNEDLRKCSLECQESERENGIQTVWGYTNENSMFTEVLVYQRLPLPEEFQINTMTISDTEYLALIQDALGLLGEKYFDKIQKVIHLKDESELTVEIVKEEIDKIVKLIDDERNKQQNSFEAYFAFKDAEAVAGYFTPIDCSDDNGFKTVWTAAGKRWVLTRSFDLFGENSINGYGAISLFDGALHLIETANYDYAVSSFRYNDGSVADAILQTENSVIKGEQESEGRSAIVATKSSPLTLRKTPGKDGEKILSIPKGESVIVIEEGEWPLVRYKNSEGYVDGRYLK